MTPSKIQGLFKLQRYISTLFGQRGGQRENSRVSHEAASKTSHSRVFFRQPLTRGLPKCRSLNMKGEWTARWISHEQCCLFLLRRFVFCTEASIKRVNWWQSAKDHEKERKRGEVPSRPFCASLHPLCAHFHRERETFGYDAVNSSLGVILLVTASITWQVMQDVF